MRPTVTTRPQRLGQWHGPRGAAPRVAAWSRITAATLHWTELLAAGAPRPATSVVAGGRRIYVASAVFAGGGRPTPGGVGQLRCGRRWRGGGGRVAVYTQDLWGFDHAGSVTASGGRACRDGTAPPARCTAHPGQQAAPWSSTREPYGATRRAGLPGQASFTIPTRRHPWQQHPCPAPTILAWL